MKLYQTLKGTWAKSEKDWKDAMKAEGSDPKAMPRNTVEIPTKAVDLMEFLTFHHINILNPQGAVPAAPDAPAEHAPAPPVVPSAPAPTVPDLDALFEAASLAKRLDLAVCAVDAAHKALFPGAPGN